MAALHMTRDERERFVADVRIGVLAVATADGAPLQAPIWYQYEPGGDLLFTTGRDSAKHLALVASGRASVCVQVEEYPYAYVTIEGPVTIGAPTDAERTEIAVRYLGDELGRRYASDTDGTLAVAVRITPERWLTTDYAKSDVPVA
jgi:PPOX class probable F420-dependent enzyme